MDEGQEIHIQIEFRAVSQTTVHNVHTLQYYTKILITPVL